MNNHPVTEWLRNRRYSIAEVYGIWMDMVNRDPAYKNGWRGGWREAMESYIESIS